MNIATEIVDILQNEVDMIEHGFFVQCITDDNSIEFDSRVEAILSELLSSGIVEIGEENQLGPGATEFVAWRGTVQDRIHRAMKAVGNAVGQDKQFAYWLCLHDNVDRYEESFH